MISRIIAALFLATGAVFAFLTVMNISIFGGQSSSLLAVSCVIAGMVIEVIGRKQKTLGMVKFFRRITIAIVFVGLVLVGVHFFKPQIVSVRPGAVCSLIAVIFGAVIDGIELRSKSKLRLGPTS